MYLVNFYGVFLTKKFDQVNVFNLVFVGVFISSMANSLVTKIFFL